MIKGAMDSFKLDLLNSLNGPQGYRRSSDCVLRMDPIKERIEAAAKTLEELHTYAHEAKHDLEADLAGMNLYLAAMRKEQRGPQER